MEQTISISAWFVGFMQEFGFRSFCVAVTFFLCRLYYGQIIDRLSGRIRELNDIAHEKQILQCTVNEYKALTSDLRKELADERHARSRLERRLEETAKALSTVNASDNT